MSLKVLVVEDNEEVYQYFMRLFEHILEVERFEFVHVSTIQAALEVLPEEWDVVLMDYALGKAAEIDQMTFRNGADLVSYRRALEDMASQEGAEQRCPKCRIVGTSSNMVSNDLMFHAGAEEAFLKLDVPQIADYLKELLKMKATT